MFKKCLGVYDLECKTEIFNTSIRF